MKDLTTPNPPSLRITNGELCIVTTFNLNGETYMVSASLGDGRYHAERVFELIIAPAIARRPTDPVMSDEDGPYNEF